MPPRLDKITLRPNPVTGPLLVTVLGLDRSYPGYLRYLTTASSLKRQTNFIALAILDERGSDYLASHFRAAGLTEGFSGSDSSAQVARVLITARAQDICRSEALFGANSCASGGVLHRIGNDPLSPSAYHSLIQLMRNTQHRDRARVLSQGCSVSDFTVAAALRLPLPLVRQEIISRVHAAERIDELIVAFNLMFPLVPEAAMPEVWQSLESLPPGRSLKRWLERVIDKVPRFPISGPVSDDGETTFLSSPRAMREAGLRLQNCLGTRINDSLLQRCIFYFWHDPEAIVELQCLSKGYFLVRGVHGKANGALDGDVLRKIRAKFEATGKVLVGAESAHAKEINRCSKLLDVWNRELPDLHDDEIMDLMEVEDAA
ncbi:hypothetical protein JKG68_07440 [Microvirga aerilata]|uniref:Uncharacterized protein n=1 Tax=Microvirga aerilata TaxID=670292 RepID=A0A936Z7P3_9HYPH|nr:hypothetical protein [Microvirga aerilata]MBL0403792.1 hypothetical protein [Microvirga aerilata]